MIHIVSDGTTFGTKVYDEDGKQMSGVSRIEIEPLDAKNDDLVVKAKLTFVKVKLDLKGQIIIKKEKK